MEKEMIVIRYDWQDANKEVGNIHPQKDLRNRGCITGKYEAVGIADCSFIEIDKLPDPCPAYIQLSKHKIIEDI